MARKKKSDKNLEVQPMQLDLSALGGDEQPAPPAVVETRNGKPASKPAKRKRASKPAKEASEPAASVPAEVAENPVLSVEDYLTQGFDQVLDGFFADPALTFAVERKVWNGYNKGKTSRFDGLRRLLRKAGFEIVDRVFANGEDGKLSKATYSDGERALEVEYGKAPGYGHYISAS